MAKLERAGYSSIVVGSMPASDLTSIAEQERAVFAPSYFNARVKGERGREGESTTSGGHRVAVLRIMRGAVSRGQLRGVNRHLEQIDLRNGCVHVTPKGSKLPSSKNYGTPKTFASHHVWIYVT